MDPAALDLLNSDVPVTGNPRIDHWLALAGALVPAASAFAGMLNQKIRDAQAEGEEVPEFLLNLAAAVNFVAVNLDKSKQLTKMVKEMRLAKKGKLAAAPAAAPNVAPAAEEPSHIPAGPAPVDPPKLP